MTPDEALEVVADEVTRAAMQEVIDNGLVDTYVDAAGRWARQHSEGPPDRTIRSAARPGNAVRCPQDACSSG